MQPNLQNFSQNVLNAVGSFFKTQRMLKGLSVAEVAHHARLESAQILMEYECGIKPIPSFEIFRIAEAMQIPERVIANLLYDIYIESVCLSSLEEEGSINFAHNA